MTDNKVDNPKPNNDGLDADGNPIVTPQPKDGEGKPKGDGSQPTPIKKGEPTDGRIIPESYELKAPKDSTLDESVIKEVAAFAKDHKLTNDEAQAILERENALKATIIEGQAEELAQKKEEWFASAKADNEIGGEKFEENASIAKRVVDKFGTPAFKDALNKSGLGNHPEVIRIFTRMGRHLKDDDLIMAGSAPTGKKSMEEIFYGDSNKK